MSDNHQCLRVKFAYVDDGTFYLLEMDFYSLLYLHCLQELFNSQYYRLIKNFLRNQQGNARLSRLALMTIYRNITFNVDKTINIKKQKIINIHKTKWRNLYFYCLMS